MIEYRKSLALSLVTKAFLSIANQLDGIKDDRDSSGAKGITEFEQKSSQYFTVVPDTQQKYDAVARPMGQFFFSLLENILIDLILVHMSAYKQASGEAIYCDDIPFFENELTLVFVTSKRAHAKILSIDTSEALKLDGVEGVVGVEDIGVDRNCWGTVIYDEKVFYYDEVTSQGQIIGA